MDPRLSGIAQSLQGIQRLGIAYSGGVDSAVLLAAAVRILGAERVVGLLGVSPSLPQAERAAAHEVAAVIGAQVLEVRTKEGRLPAYIANGPDRCFHCKDELFTRIEDEVVDANGLDAVAYGENADDARRLDRPGALAATRHRVLRPLADAGLTKEDVRALARDWELPCADKPAAPCLASRIPHHSEVTPGKLQQVERAEAAVRALGFADLRVRHHGALARVEFAQVDLPRATSPHLRDRVHEAVRQAGFEEVLIDPRGLQSGAFTMAALQDEHG